MLKGFIVFSFNQPEGGTKLGTIRRYSNKVLGPGPSQLRLCFVRSPRLATTTLVRARAACILQTKLAHEVQTPLVWYRSRTLAFSAPAKSDLSRCEVGEKLSKEPSSRQELRSRFLGRPR